MDLSNVIDIAIILFLIMSGIIGFKRGILRQGIGAIGTILIFILAWNLKNPIGNFLSLNLPFFSFGGIFKGVTSLNIILYQLIAFLIVIAILEIIFNVILNITGIIEKILKYTIVLGIPSKLLGLVFGLLEGYIIIFVALFFLNQPAFNIDVVNNSKLTPKILNSSIFLSKGTESVNNTINDIFDLTEKYKNTKNDNDFNKEAIDTMLKYNVVEVKQIDKLIEKDKIKVIGINTILNKYRKD